MDGSELPQLLRVIAAFAFVMALMGGFLIVLKKLNLTQAGNTKRRLKIVEVLHLDNRRKLAIIQRDEKQHLILLGHSSETVIESGIESGIESHPESGQDTAKDKDSS